MPEQANDGQGEFIQPSQDTGDNPLDVFNEQIPLMTEDEGLITGNQFSDNEFEAAPAAAAPAAQTPAPTAQQPGAPTQGANGENIFEKEENIFEDEIVKQFAPKDQDQFNSDEAIKKLQEQGFVVEKKELTDVDQIEKNEFKRLENEYAQAQNFLQQDDDSVIREKVRNDLAKEYQSFGKAHAINTDEFEIEVENKVERISENETSKKLYADNIRRNIQEYSEGIKNKKQEITEKQELKIKQDLAARRQNLQGAISGLMKGKFLGMDVTKEVAQEIYNDITSGNFTKEIDANPQLVAEFALYKKNRESIMNSFGGATFGEGVKAAVDAINKTGSTATRSSLQQAMTGSSNAQGSVSRRSAWAMPVIEDTNEQKPVAPQVVAGRGGY